MSVKSLLIIALIAGAAFYVVKVKGFNPFSSHIDGRIPLNSLDGSTATLGEYAGENGTLIFFMSTWCPHCAEEVQYLKSLTDFLRLHKINVIFGMYGPSRDEIHSWVGKQDLPWDWKTFYWEDEFYYKFHLKKERTPYLTARNKKGDITFSMSGAHFSDKLSEVCTEMLKSNQ